MTLRTCLLLTDDPDDHVEFTEALQEVAENTAVIIVTNPDKASRLLAMKKLAPDLMILDAALMRSEHNTFFDTIKNDSQLCLVPLVVYGESSDMETVNHPAAFLHSDMTYSQLRKALLDVLEMGSTGHSPSGIHRMGGPGV